MSEEDRLDIIETTDEDGQHLFLWVERYFFFNGEEYVLLKEVADENGTARDGETVHHIMQVAVSTDVDGEEVEDFLPVEEDLRNRLLQAAEIRYTRPEETAPKDD